MIKAILFDFDGVLTIDRTGSATITNYISKVCNLPLDKVKSCYYKFNKGLLMGEITHRDIWEEFCADLGTKIDYDILLDSFRYTSLDMKMIGLLKELKENYMIGMITDNKCDRIDVILEYKGLQTYFDVVAISARLHSGKEDPAIFQYVLDNLKVQVNECIFIDNMQKNLVVPKKMGMRTILFDDITRDYDSFIRYLDESMCCTNSFLAREDETYS